MLIQGTVASQTAQSTQPGTVASVRLGQLNDVVVSELHGRYYEANYRKSRFGGAMQAVIATATTAGAGATVTGAPVLYNPFGSGVNVVLERVGIAFVIASANASAYGLQTGFSPTAVSGTLTSLTPKSKNIGSGAQPIAGLVASASVTLPVAATVDTVLGTILTGAITTTSPGAGGLFEIQGSIVLPPGGYCAFWSSAIIASSSLLMSMDWEEVPV